MSAVSAMKIDFKKELPSYTAPRGRFDLVEVPPLQYVMVDGAGDPNTSKEYADAVSALFGVSYKLKFLSKKELGRDYVVMPLEALWWSDDMDTFTTARDKSRWSWTAMILAPEWITAEHVRQACDAVAAKGDAPAIPKLRLETLDEGLSVQTLHLGPYDVEGPVLDALHHEFVPAQGLRLTGKHHEIYLSDVRRTDPAKLRTILRQPVERAAAQ
jgi:hypothetical protein